MSVPCLINLHSISIKTFQQLIFFLVIGDLVFEHVVFLIEARTHLHVSSRGSHAVDLTGFGLRQRVVKVGLDHLISLLLLLDLRADVPLKFGSIHELILHDCIVWVGDYLFANSFKQVGFSNYDLRFLPCLLAELEIVLRCGLLKDLLNWQV